LELYIHASDIAHVSEKRIKDPTYLFIIRVKLRVTPAEQITSKPKSMTLQTTCREDLSVVFQVSNDSGRDRGGVRRETLHHNNGSGREEERTTCVWITEVIQQL
jgi:hypothetical protein